MVDVNIPYAKYRYAILDTESTGLNRYKDTINYIGVGLAEDIGKPLAHRLVFNAHKPKDMEAFEFLVINLRRHKIKLIWQNGKHDTLFIELEYGYKLPIHHDVMLLGTAYDLSAKHGLKEMAVAYLGVSNWDIPLKEKVKPNSPLVEEYLIKDLDNPWDLFNYFMERLNDNQWRIYKHLLKPSYLMYRKAERKGIYLNRKGLAKVKLQYKEQEKLKLAELIKEHDINWNSPQQVAKALFEVDKMPTIKLSPKTGKPSADAKVLRRLKAKGFELPEKLLDYKFYYGANTKFLNAWGDYAAYDGRIHPHFHLDNVVTGRTSCSDPNIQQVPRNKELRTLFTAPKGKILMEADYSQIELRIAAHYSNDPVMLKIYREGGDIHTRTAMSLTGLTAEEVKGEPRSKAKPVNFGFLYGMSAKGFVDYAFDNYDVVFTKPEAEKYRQLFFLTYPRLLQWHKEMEIICEALGGVEDLFGRFRSLPDIYDQDNYIRSKAVRRAINTPVQGTASNLLLVSAVEIDKKLGKRMNLEIVGTVHDSILMEVPEDCAKDAEKEVKKIMANPEALEIFEIELKVPIEADVGFGPWGSK